MIIRVINKIGRPRFTVLDDTNSPTRHRSQFPKKKQIHLGQTIAVETMSKEKNFLQLEIVIVINTVITGVRLQETVRIQLNRMISEE